MNSGLTPTSRHRVSSGGRRAQRLAGQPAPAAGQPAATFPAAPPTFGRSLCSVSTRSRVGCGNAPSGPPFRQRGRGQERSHELGSVVERGKRHMRCFHVDILKRCQAHVHFLYLNNHFSKSQECFEKPSNLFLQNCFFPFDLG